VWRGFTGDGVPVAAETPPERPASGETNEDAAYNRRFARMSLEALVKETGGAIE